MCPGVALTQKHSPNTCLKGEKGLCLREAPRALHNNRQTSRRGLVPRSGVKEAVLLRGGGVMSDQVLW